MKNKFIYVFDKYSRDKLLSSGYKLMKSDEKQSVFVFINENNCVFSLTDIKLVFSDTLTF